jgi:hypothetical protein
LNEAGRKQKAESRRQLAASVTAQPFRLAEGSAKSFPLLVKPGRLLQSLALKSAEKGFGTIIVDCPIASSAKRETVSSRRPLPGPSMEEFFHSP